MRTNAVPLAAALLAAGSLLAAEPVPAGDAPGDGFTRDVDAAAALAKERGLPLLLDFTGDWCGYCRWMEREVFSKDAWKAWAATGVVVAAIDFPADAADASDRARGFAERYGIRGFPTYVLLSPEGEEIGRLGWSRDATPETFAGRIRAAVIEADPAKLAAALPPDEAEEFARLKARIKAIETGEAVEGFAELEARIEAWEKRLDEAKGSAPETVRALQSEAVSELTPLRRDVNARIRALAPEYGRAVERLGELRAKLAR